jgi:hypothetical protein
MKILGDIGGINSASYLAYVAALSDDDVLRRFHVEILDRNEKEVGELTLNDEVFVLDGSVQIDATAAVTRQLNLLLLDPKRRVFFDPDVPSAKALFMDRFIRVYHELWVDELGKWIKCPIFTGPITKLDQDGMYISVEAMGKESLLLAPALHWRTRTFKKNMKVRTIIRTLLQDRGEAKMDLPEFTKRLRKPLSVLPTQETWKVINKLAKSANMHCFYDGAGVFRMRRKPTNVIYVFRRGVDILTDPSQPYDFTAIRNTIQVRGPKPEQKNQRQIIETVRLAPTHPMSPQSLMRNGKGRFLVSILQQDHLRKRVRAKEIGRRELRNSTDFAVDLTFDSLVVPFFDELDVAAAVTLFGRMRFAMKKWTIPMSPATGMSVGFNKRPKMMKRRFRPRKVA